MPELPSERAFAAAKLVLAKCMAYDPHFANPSQATVMAWAEHITMRNISDEDMLAGVAQFYADNRDGMKPLPATISFLAREIIRERSGRESLEQREEREARLDAKVEGLAQNLDAPALPSRSEKISMEEWEERHGMRFPAMALGLDIGGPNPLKVRCLWCQAPIGSRCVIPGSSQQLSNTDFHDVRKAQVNGYCAHTAGWHVHPHTEGCDQWAS